MGKKELRAYTAENRQSKGKDILGPSPLEMPERMN
jgi:hypothetical protein